MLLRLLIYVFLVYLLFLLLRGYLGGRKAARSRRSAEASANAEEMVFDPQCKSYVPKGEAIYREGEYFCSQECARLYLTR